MMNICRGCASLDGAQAGDGLDYDDFKSAGESGDADAHAGRRRPFGIVHIGMQAIKINPGNKQISGWCKQWRPRIVCTPSIHGHLEQQQRTAEACSRKTGTVERFGQLRTRPKSLLSIS